MPTRRITLEESDNDDFNRPQDDSDDNYSDEINPDGEAPSMEDSGSDGNFTPGGHPWDYNDEAKAKIADIILMPDRDKLREFTKIPQGILFDMCLGDVMVEAMEQYNNPKFNAAGYLMKIIDQRLRAHDGWITKLATVLAGDEARGEDVNPMGGPQI
jgi:hypothetical protein